MVRIHQLPDQYLTKFFSYFINTHLHSKVFKLRNGLKNKLCRVTMCEWKIGQAFKIYVETSQRVPREFSDLQWPMRHSDIPTWKEALWKYIVLPRSMMFSNGSIKCLNLDLTFRRWLAPTTSQLILHYSLNQFPVSYSLLH